MKAHPRPKEIVIDAKITRRGIDIYLNKERFPIIYPAKVWQSYDLTLKKVLADTLAHSSSFYIPQILRIPEVTYKTSRPLAESFFYKNGIYDIPYCANVDSQSSVKYLTFFFKTQYKFASEEIKTPPKINFDQKSKRPKRAIIPFSFGKESMMTYSLCKEIGIEPILVSIIDPSHKYEYLHKKPLMDAFEKQEKIKVHIIEYNPGWFWEGRWWNITTELGWGLHVTEYSILMLPFVSYFNADYIINGNEQSCKDTYLDSEDLFIYRAGFEQHPDWTHQQGFLCSLLLGRKVDVLSVVEPLYEIAETKILQGRYRSVGQYQMSCFAVNEGAKNSRWCQNCNKCAYFYLLFTAFKIDPKQMGYTANMMDKKYYHLYETCFTRTSASYYYGSQGELGLAFYYSYLNGVTGYTMEKFKQTLLPQFKKNLRQYIQEYLTAHETKNMPPDIKKKIMAIYRQELRQFLTHGN